MKKEYSTKTWGKVEDVACAFSCRPVNAVIAILRWSALKFCQSYRRFKIVQARKAWSFLLSKAIFSKDKDFKDEKFYKLYSKISWFRPFIQGRRERNFDWGLSVKFADKFGL